MQQAIINCSIHTGDDVIKDSAIILENGIVQAIQKELPENIQLLDLNGKNISAGLIDIQLNGGEQFHFSKQPTEETINDLYESSLKYGTTHILPCLISSSPQNILAGIEAMRAYKQKYNNGVIGMHLEGPFINPVKRGAHLAQNVRAPINAELAEIIHYGKDVIKIITIAPECFKDAQIDMLLESGIVVSAGHSNMTYQQAQYYFGKGIHLVTHLFNAMTQFGHREPGLVGAALENEKVFTPVILDGAHCDYAAARLAYKLKGDKFLLISDALFLGGKVKQFEWEGFEATLINGLYRNEEGNLAGAAISMKDAVQNAIDRVEIPMAEAIKMATSRVAEAIEMDKKIGRIKAGFSASFVTFNDDFESLETLLL